MSPSPPSVPRWESDVDRSRELLKSRTRELSQLFRALIPAITNESESSQSRTQVSFSALAEAEQVLTSYFHASRVGLGILDSEFRYIAVNPTLAEINRVPAKDHLSKTIREVLGDFAELVEAPIQQVFTTGRPVLNLELSHRLPNRPERAHWTVQYIPIPDEEGNVSKVGAIVLEITEQKRLEESLRHISATLRDEKRRMQVAIEVSRALTAKLDVQQVFPKISAYLRRVLRQEYAALVLRDEKTGRLARRAMDFPMQKGSPKADAAIDLKQDPRGKALTGNGPLIFNREQMKDFPPAATDYLLAEGLQTLCCVPLLRPSGALGVMVLGSTRRNAFTSDDLVLADQVAAQLAIALENAGAAREVSQLKSRADQEKRYLEGEARAQLRFEGIVGESAALNEVLNQVSIVAGSDATVLILGETGTGKGLIARAIHQNSKRKDKGFITLNCAAIPTGLLESELFGHEKGAFTGAVSQKVGRLELAHGGTLFLDEIGEIPLELQPKLLRVLQDHEFERLGATRTIKVDVRLIAATNRDLAKRVAEKNFRSDLFYRVNVFPIRLPSLRERREDIPLLVRYFVRKFALGMDRGIETVPSETMDALVNWRWPGNVRELENFIERSVILTDGAALRAPLAEFRAETAASTESSLEEKERQHIVRILRETRGVISGPGGAARLLGLKRSTLQSKIQRLGINRAEFLGPKNN